ncbi:hypothetical protein QBC42DRAFT_326761 [Cladorrhinum samala]|uniref:ubiquitinyl hydrolase 1 n=1 Tax=Cladorrhinum samala TaxID=585594 RepID=A0AAV9HRU8_9PEZI|nr:hypothetical protein QBC42DRAFT_326761 [Cladorrhinum samala]
MCRYCRYHWAFSLTPGPPNSINNEHPQHFFIVSHSESQPELEASGDADVEHYPLVRRTLWSCSCSMALTLEITAPRMSPDWIEIIADKNRIESNLRLAKQEDPERYKDVDETKAEFYKSGSLGTLNTYISNILDDDGTGKPKRISVRNKTFSIQYGAQCEFIFKSLGFRKENDQNDETFWLPPRLPPQDGKTPLRSQRAYYEDVKSEIQSILELNRNPGQAIVKPSEEARGALQKGLGLETRTPVPRELRKPNDGTDLHYCLACLGAPSNASDELLIYAYKEQIKRDPQGKDYLYLHALKALATYGGSPEMQMFCFDQDQPVDPIQSSLSYFGFPPNSLDSLTLRTAIEMVPQWTKLRNSQPPLEMAQARQHIVKIGKYLERVKGKHDVSSVFLTAAYAQNMGYHEALHTLGVKEDTDLDYIASYAIGLWVEESCDQGLIVLALEALLNHSPAQDDAGRASLENTLRDLRSRIGVLGPELAAATSQSTSVELPALRPSLPPPPTLPPRAEDLPLGLDNLRNTCYLNSLIQYVYTIPAVRDFVLNYTVPDMDTRDTESAVADFMIRNGITKGSTGLELTTGEVFCAHVFTRELGVLFRDLQTPQDAGQTWIRPRQRLANATLIQAHRQGSISTPKKQDGKNNESLETASDSSDVTLVEIAGEEMPEAGEGAEQEAARPRRAHYSVETLAKAINSDETTGTEQEDIGEAWSSVKSHLEIAAVLAGPESRSRDLRDLFITKCSNYRRFVNTSWEVKPEERDFITVNPKPLAGKSLGEPNLYQALADTSFDLETMDESKGEGALRVQFHSIDTPAPHFHVFIQRNFYRQGRDNTALEIPETIYLKRFIYSPDSANFEEKTREWALKTRLREINAEGMERRSSDDEISDFMDAIQEHASIKVEDISSKYASIKALSQRHGVALEEPDQVLVDLPDAETPGSDPLSGVGPVPPSWDSLHARMEKEEADQIKILKAELDELLAKQKDVPYRLHTIFCNPSQIASAGHYYVWIHDFEQGVWRKYNDKEVKVETDPKNVFTQIDRRAAYYLAYVKESDAAKLANIPRRGAAHQNQQTGDIEMGGTSGTSEHVEHVEHVEHAEHFEHVDHVEHTEPVKPVPPPKVANMGVLPPSPI